MKIYIKNFQRKLNKNFDFLTHPSVKLSFHLPHITPMAKIKLSKVKSEWGIFAIKNAVDLQYDFVDDQDPILRSFWWFEFGLRDMRVTYAVKKKNYPS